MDLPLLPTSTRGSFPSGFLPFVPCDFPVPSQAGRLNPRSPPFLQIKDLALSQLNSSNGELRDHTHSNGCSHAQYDPLSPTALGELTDRHVAETVKAVAESQIVTEAWKEGKQLSVHGWVYHVSFGFCFPTNSSPNCFADPEYEGDRSPRPNFGIWISDGREVSCYFSVPSSSYSFNS